MLSGFGYFFSVSEDLASFFEPSGSVPESKNLSMLMIFLRKPHWLYSTASTPSSLFYWISMITYCFASLLMLRNSFSCCYCFYWDIALLLVYIPSSTPVIRYESSDGTLSLALHYQLPCSVTDKDPISKPTIMDFWLPNPNTLAILFFYSVKN